MRAERPMLAPRSWFGSSCAIWLAALCLAYGFAGCLNPLTDDQPSSRNDSSPVVTPENPNGAGNGVTPGSGSNDFIVDEPAEQAPASPGSSDPDAGQLDAGPDSGSLGQQP